MCYCIVYMYYGLNVWGQYNFLDEFVVTLIILLQFKTILKCNLFM